MMTKQQAQEIVEKEGFAWTVTEVHNGDAFTVIDCIWDGNEKYMMYSNGQNKVVSIGAY